MSKPIQFQPLSLFESTISIYTSLHSKWKQEPRNVLPQMTFSQCEHKGMKSMFKVWCLFKHHLVCSHLGWNRIQIVSFRQKLHYFRACLLRNRPGCTQEMLVKANSHCCNRVWQNQFLSLLWRLTTVPRSSVVFRKRLKTPSSWTQW